MAVSNIPVPYISPLIGSSEGVLVDISGITQPQSKWFAINLQCGPSVNPRDDLALHISPRFDGNLSKVVRNSLERQQWGVEEDFGHFPFIPGQPFSIMILFDNDNFKIAINGQHYTEFRHRILPLQRINTIAIDGDVSLTSVKYEQSRRPPSPLPGGYAQPQPQGQGGGIGFAPQMQQGVPPSYQQQPVPSYGGMQSHLGIPTMPMHISGDQNAYSGSNYGHGGGDSHGKLKAGAVSSRLMYPGAGHSSGMGGMMMGGHGMKQKKMKKNKGMKGMKMKHHKPKSHKFKHKKNSGSSGSSSSSSSDEEE